MVALDLVLEATHLGDKGGAGIVKAERGIGKGRGEPYLVIGAAPVVGVRVAVVVLRHLD